MLVALERRATVIAFTAAAIVLVAGAVYSFVLGPDLHYYDERDYVGFAHGIVELGHYSRDGTTPTAIRPPGYPFFLAPWVALGANPPVLRTLNFACLAASILLLYVLARRIGGALAGVLASALALFYPIFFYAAGKLYPQTLASTLLLLLLVMVVRVDRPPGIARAAVAGAVFGFLILTVPTFAFSFLIVGLWLLLTHRRRAIPACTTGLVVALLVLGSWQVRNYRTFGEFIFVSTNSGVNLLLGNSENARADSGTTADITQYRDAANALTEVERDRFFRNAALDWIADNPASAARLYGAKWLHYFSYRDQLATKSQKTTATELLMLVSYAPLFLLVLLRLAFWRRLPIGRDELLLIALFFLSSFFQAVFFTRLRFRIPMDHLLIGIAAIFVALVLRRMIGEGDISRQSDTNCEPTPAQPAK